MDNNIVRMLATDREKFIQEYITWKTIIDNMVHQMYSIPKDIIIDRKRISEQHFRLKLEVMTMGDLLEKRNNEIF